MLRHCDVVMLRPIIRAARLPQHRAKPPKSAGCTHRVWHSAGFSVLQTMIANTLALILLGVLATASGDVVSAINIAKAEVDQRLRLRQVNRFLDNVIEAARMPDEWQGLYPGEGSIRRFPSDPCVPPETLSNQQVWGGIALLDTVDAPCLSSRSSGVGLYIERVLRCPRECDTGKGYALIPARCVNPDVADSDRVVWVARWMDSLADVGACAQHLGWGRLERLFMIHRKSTSGVESAATLRLQVPLSQGRYGWGSAEILATGIREWEMTPVSIEGSDFPANTLGREMLQITMSVSGDPPLDPIAALSMTRLILL